MQNISNLIMIFYKLENEQFKYMVWSVRVIHALTPGF